MANTKIIIPTPSASDGETLTTSTLTAPVINGASSASGNFDLSGSSGTFKTTTGVSTFGGSSNIFTGGTIGPTSGQQHTLPAVTSDTIALIAATQTLTNKTISAGSNTITGVVTSVATTARLTGGPITSTGTLDLATVGTPGTYTSVTTDAYGRVTSGGAGGGGGTVTNVATDSTLTGGPITTTGTLGIDLTNANTWTNQTFTAPIINGATSASGNFDLSGSTGTFLTTTGISTFGGSANNFTNAATIAATSNQLTLGASGHKTIITSTAPAGASNTLTIPDTAGADTFTFNAFAQTLTNKTFDGTSNVALTSGSYADPSWITSLSGTKITSATIVASTKMNATGTPSATTYLRGDNTWATPAGGGSTGNWTFSSDAADDSGANIMTIGAATATGVTLSRSAGTITMAAPTVFAANMGVTVTAGTSAFDFSGGTGTFLTTTGAVTIGGNTTHTQGKTLTMGIDAVGTAQTVHTLIKNTTAAANGAQQYSPLIQLAGLGWGTTAGTSQAVTASLQLRPIQSTVPTGDLDIGFSIAGGAYAVKASFLSAGGLAVAKVGPTDAQQHTLPAVTSDTVALLAAAQTFTTKTLTSPIINTATSTVSTAHFSGSAANAHGLTITPFITDTTTTAATAGVQKASRGIEMAGNGWKTTATAASQAVSTGLYTLPIQNTTSPSASMVWYTSINGGTKTARLNLVYDPVAGTSTIYGPVTTVGATQSAYVTFGTSAQGLTLFDGGNGGSDAGIIYSSGNFRPVNNNTADLGFFGQAWGAAVFMNPTSTTLTGFPVTCATGTGAGTGATCTVVANSNLYAGSVSVTTAGTPAGSGATIVTLTAGAGQSAQTRLVAQVAADDNTTAGFAGISGIFCTCTTSTIAIKTSSATPLTTATTYVFSWLAQGSNTN